MKNIRIIFFLKIKKSTGKNAKTTDFLFVLPLKFGVITDQQGTDIIFCIHLDRCL